MILPKHIMQPQHYENKQKNAYVTLTSVIILGAVAGIIATTALYLSADSARNNATTYSNVSATAMANSCADVAVNKLKDDVTYTGNETITIAGEDCTIVTVLGTGNTNRTVRAEATINDATSRVEVFVNEINPNTDIEYWEEVGSF